MGVPAWAVHHWDHTRHSTGSSDRIGRRSTPPTGCGCSSRSSYWHWSHRKERYPGSNSSPHRGSSPRHKSNAPCIRHGTATGTRPAQCCRTRRNHITVGSSPRVAWQTWYEYVGRPTVPFPNTQYPRPTTHCNCMGWVAPPHCAAPKSSSRPHPVQWPPRPARRCSSSNTRKRRREYSNVVAVDGGGDGGDYRPLLIYFVAAAPPCCCWGGCARVSHHRPIPSCEQKRGTTNDAITE